MRLSGSYSISLLALACAVGCSDDAESTSDSVPDPLLAEYVISGSPDLFPEGIAFDPMKRRFLVGSLNGGAITAIEADGTQSILTAAPDSGEGSCAGLDVDSERRRLVACGSDGPALGSQIWFIDLDSGARLGAVSLEEAFTGATCNDLALDSAGRAFVTDSRNPNLYLAELGVGASLWASGDLLDPSPGELSILGLNGIEVSPDNSTVLATKYHPARLIALPLDEPTQMKDVTLSGDEYPGTALSGADGLVFHGDDLVAIFAGEAKRIRFSNGYLAGEVKTFASPVTTGLSTGAVAEGELFAVKSEVVHFSLGTMPELPFKILRVDLE